MGNAPPQLTGVHHHSPPPTDAISGRWTIVTASYFILVLIAGYMTDAEIAISAFSICLNVSSLQFMICVGFLGAACVRVANELGRGDAKAVKFSIKVILSTSVLLGVVFCILCLIFGHNISYLFTSNEEVAETVSDLSVLLAFTMLLNSIQRVLTRVAIGAGLQGTAAIINLCCYYVIGIPVGVLLAYVADLGVKKYLIFGVELVVTQIWGGGTLDFCISTVILGISFESMEAYKTWVRRNKNYVHSLESLANDVEAKIGGGLLSEVVIAMKHSCKIGGGLLCAHLFF